MSQFIAVIFDPGAHPVSAVVSAVSVGAKRSSVSREVLAILPHSSADKLDAIATDASRIAGRVISLRASTSSDIYELAQYTNGACTRRISYTRDAEPSKRWELWGDEETWERDLVFALPVEEFLDYLSDDEEWSDVDLEQARISHEAKNLELLGRRPPLLAASLWKWLSDRGFDVDRSGSLSER